MVFFLPSNAYAYLEPGTLSLIINSIIAFFASIAAYSIIYLDKFKIFIKKIFNKKTKE